MEQQHSENHCEKHMEKKLHFIGIGGIGMSAIARILLGQGFGISGSDVKRGRLTEVLENEGAHISYGHAAENLPADAEAVVYSSAVTEANPEMAEARRRGLPVYRRAELLAYLMRTRKGIGVAGTHGKTTVSGMISTMLELCGMDPTVVIGGILPLIGSNAKPGDGAYLVAEADESDGTFLLLYPEIAVITNIESDHLNHYGDLEHIKQAFRQYVAQLPPHGFAVMCADCPICREIMADAPARCISYGLQQPADYNAKNMAHNNGGIGADIYRGEEFLGRLQLLLPGEHTIGNALSALIVGMELGLSFDEAAAALGRFTGTGRRFEELAKTDEIRVIDDYAHHPTEIAATIRAARGCAPKRLLAVFQPHRYTRTQAHYREFAAALAEADLVVVNEIYPAFEPPIPGVDARLIIDTAAQQGFDKMHYAPDIFAVVEQLKTLAQPGDLVLVMGAGNIRQAAEGFAAHVLQKDN